MRLRALLPVLAGLVAVSLASACGSSSTPTSSPSPTSNTPATQAPTPTPATPTPTATGALSGTWSGQYSGAYSGSFTLTWQESGSTLSGSIQLSDPAATLSINGTLNGNAIQFGTVGSLEITYSGTVTNNTSMSGNYEVGGATGGSWSAPKSS